ncbi:MAG: ferritin family protein [Spirochaetes bacterium]|jgi:rubrerythrin|nr:ferritin family protein [Spirochaetota bacterium]
MSYSMEDIINIAIGLEESGVNFYEKCSKLFKDPGKADVFRFMVREERDHSKTFGALKSKLKSFDPHLSLKYREFIAKMGAERVFPEKEDVVKELSKIVTVVDAVDYAIKKEQETIIFYNEMKELYDNDAPELDVLNHVIREEEKHIEDLKKMK